jgi:hypothetical protein
MSEIFQPYNPLDTPNIAASMAKEILSRPAAQMDQVPSFSGSGIYIIYYTGEFPAYAPLAAANADLALRQPIYVGKAVFAGARRGVSGGAGGSPLYRRLREHAESIGFATNLEVSDFYCRFLVTEPLFIGIGETLLISWFQPVWNALVDGFGNHNPGSGRQAGMLSRWDLLHPGRPWAAHLAPRNETVEMVAAEAAQYLRERIDP